MERACRTISDDVFTKGFLDFSFQAALDARDWLLDRIDADLAKENTRGRA
jgi:hypothetical protein